MSAAFEVEQLLFEAMECNMYKIPPLQNTAGHKAAEWQDKLIWTGVCKVIAKGSTATVKLLEANGTVFAQCPIQSGANAPKSIISVVDSSRYFVLRVEDAGRHAYIGIGFKDRDEAFDFKVAITDHKRQETRSESQPVYTGPKQDLELKAGAKIVVNLGGKVKAAEKKNKTFTGLAPPPASGSARVLPPPPRVQQQVTPAPVVQQQYVAPTPVVQQVAPTPTPTPVLQQDFFQPQVPLQAPKASAQPQVDLFSAPVQSRPQQQDLFSQPQQAPAATQDLFQAAPPQRPAPSSDGPNLFLPDAQPQQRQNVPFDPFAVQQKQPQPQAVQAPPVQQVQQSQPGGDLLDFGPGAQQAKSSVLDAFAASPPTKQVQAWDPFA